MLFWVDFMEGCLEGHVLAAPSMISRALLLSPWLHGILCDDQSQSNGSSCSCSVSRVAVFCWKFMNSRFLCLKVMRTSQMLDQAQAH